MKFTGEIQLLPDCPEYAKPLILAALRHINALGGSKSAGLGWLSWENLETLQINDESWKLLLPKTK